MDDNGRWLDSDQPAISDGDALMSGKTGASPCDTNTCIRVHTGGPVVRVISTMTSTVMVATHEEWDDFLKRVRRGEFDPERKLTDVERYAVNLVADGAESTAEDDLNECGDLCDADHLVAMNLALDAVQAIRRDPAGFLKWALGR